MKKIIRDGLKHPLISGSAIIFFGGLFTNFLNFIFTVVMGRVLSESDYGTLISLISLIVLIGIGAGAVVPMLINFAGSYFAKQELGKIRGLFLKVVSILGTVGLIILLVFLFFTKEIGTFFKINNNILIILAGLSIFTNYVGTINSGLLQAKLNFKFITFSGVLSTAIKLFLGLILVYFGFSITGAVFALFLSFLIPYLVSFIPLKFLLDRGISSVKVNVKELIYYGAPASVAQFSLMSFIMIDMILVKHFFPSTASGAYASLSTIGKAIYFFSAPINTVMFPLIVQKYAKGENFHGTFKLAMFLIAALSLPVLIFYFLFPHFTVQIFYNKKEYLSIAPILPYFGLYISLYSLLSILTNFFLSIKKTKISIPILMGAILQIILIWFYHGSFYQIITISILIVSLLLILFLLYYWKLHEDQKGQ